MQKPILLLGVLLLLSNTSSANPRIDLAEALRLAEAYVRDHKIENSGRFLSGVHWAEVVGHPEKSCWSVVWDWSSKDMLMADARLVVRVCDDGSIHHQDKWA